MEDKKHIPYIFNYVWLGPAADRFKGDNVKKFRTEFTDRFDKSNKYTYVMWVDIFSSIPADVMKGILGEKMWNIYYDVQHEPFMQPVNRDEVPSAKKISADVKETLQYPSVPPKGMSLDEVFKRLRDVQKAFNEQLKKDKTIYEKSPTWKVMEKLRDESGFQLKSLDLDLYPAWLEEKSDQAKLMNWILWHRRCRGGNWGACSDMIRIGLLIDRPGYYVDHDDSLRAEASLKWPHEMQGYTFALPKGGQGDVFDKDLPNSFFGHEQGNPFMVYLRDSLIVEHEQWIEDGKLSYCGTDVSMISAKDDSKLFERLTLGLTGPDQFRVVLNLVDKAGGNIPSKGPQFIPWSKAKGLAGKAIDHCNRIVQPGRGRAWLDAEEDAKLELARQEERKKAAEARVAFMERKTKEKEEQQKQEQKEQTLMGKQDQDAKLKNPKKEDS